MHKTRRLSPRFRRLIARMLEPERAQLDGLEVTPSGWGEFIEAGGEDRRKEPRQNAAQNRSPR
jgi:hypothetical protein